MSERYSCCAWAISSSSCTREGESSLATLTKELGGMRVTFLVVCFAMIRPWWSRQHVRSCVQFAWDMFKDQIVVLEGCKPLGDSSVDFPWDLPEG